MTLISAKSMLNTAVRTPAGKEIGTLRDFVFDPTLTRVAHAAVGTGTALGVGEIQEFRLEQMLLDTEDECFIVDLRKHSVRDG